MLELLASLNPYAWFVGCVVYSLIGLAVGAFVIETTKANAREEGEVFHDAWWVWMIAIYLWPIFAILYMIFFVIVWRQNR